jgi:2-methylcitrate dehydratase PrpD
MTSSLANSLGVFIKNLKYKDLPKEVISKAKLSLLDTLGVILAGSNTDIGTKLISMARDLGGKPESTILGGCIKVPSLTAAYVNGTMGHVHELDDGHRFALGHPGVTTIPAALALAEKVGTNGKDLITAIVVGYDIFVRIAKVVNPSHRGRGFHTTGTCGTFGAATAAGKILDLDEKGYVNAIGIAGLHASGLMEVMSGESQVKPLNAGRAAHDGILSAILAENGISAPDTILEGKKGFFKAYSDAFNSNILLEKLGGTFHIMGTYFKFHAACRHAHPAIDGIISLMSEYHINIEDIEKVIVDTYQAAYDLTGTEYEPKTESTAKFSMPYCIAATLKYGKVGIDEFTPNKISNRDTLQLAKKVVVRVDPEIDKLAPEKRGAKVTVHMKGGTKYDHVVENPRGEPENIVSKNEVIDKFKILTRNTLERVKIDTIIKSVKKLEKLDDISDLIMLLA